MIYIHALTEFEVTITGESNSFEVGDNTSLSCDVDITDISSNDTLETMEPLENITLEYEWMKDGMPIIINTVSLVLTELTLCDVGSYTCEVVVNGDTWTSEGYIVNITGNCKYCKNNDIQWCRMLGGEGSTL